MLILDRSNKKISYKLPLCLSYSYTGVLHHNDSNTIVGGTPSVNATRKWVHGTVVGVHLDRWNGTIQFFLDGVPLGMGFRGNW